jgi:hypothetical protein
VAKGVVDLAAIYMFLKRLVTPFDQWDAYKTGLIDKNGKVIVSKADRTPEQNKSFGYFDRLVANLKKLLGKIPGGKSRIASFAAALLLLREKNIDPDDIEYLEECLQHYMKEAEMLVEEGEGGPANSTSMGPGMGDDPQAFPKKKRKRKTQFITRNYIEVNGKRKRIFRG